MDTTKSENKQTKEVGATSNREEGKKQTVDIPGSSFTVASLNEVGGGGKPEKKDPKEDIPDTPEGIQKKIEREEKKRQALKKKLDEKDQRIDELKKRVGDDFSSCQESS